VPVRWLPLPAGTGDTNSLTPGAIKPSATILEVRVWGRSVETEDRRMGEAVPATAVAVRLHWGRRCGKNPRC
jgi:hypothetical protein